jgi:hypothetical protein
MITFTCGSLLGLFVGWKLCQRVYDKHLKTANEQRHQLCEALGKATAQQAIMASEFVALAAPPVTKKNISDYMA